MIAYIGIEAALSISSHNIDGVCDQHYLRIPSASRPHDHSLVIHKFQLQPFLASDNGLREFRSCGRNRTRGQGFMKSDSQRSNGLEIGATRVKL
jgi:hypothetical protein